jgi:pimeloyl-ACP methyl ester carboxylesterase
MNGRGHDMGGLDNGSPSIGWLRERLDLAPIDLGAARDVLVGAGTSRYIVVAHSYGCARTTYWLSREPDSRCVGMVLLSPPPSAKAAWAPIEGFDVEPHFEAARSAVSEGDPHRLILMHQQGPVPLLASAGTIMSVWAPGTEAYCEPHIEAIDVPCLVVVGSRESSAFHDAAQRTADLAPQGQLLVVEDNHFYRRNRDMLTRTILGWAESNRLWD